MPNKKIFSIRSFAAQLLCSCCAFALVCSSFIRFGTSHASHTDIQADVLPSDDRSFPVLVIDAGHGGIDGGATSSDGILEKDINLQISKKLARLASAYGIKCVMTRCDDELLGSSSGYGSRKLRDLQARVDIAKENGNCFFVSIHQNKFPIEKYSGLQVYYSPNNDFSQILARNIRDCTRTYLQSDNNREIKRATSSIYVLNNISSPAVLVECGFLSNRSEASLLCDEIYQKKLCAVIFGAAVNSLTEYENK